METLGGLFPLRAETDAALSQPLESPEALRNYVSDVLQKVVDIVGDATAAYDRMPTILAINPKQREEFASCYFTDVPDFIDTTVTRLTSIEREVQELLRPQTPNSSAVLVPPAPAKQPIVPGNGKHELGKRTPRAATIKFIIARLLNTPYDKLLQEGRVVTKLGEVPGDIVRKTSYECIETTDYNRTILVCDESGNRTFVFDTNRLNNLGVTGDELLAMHKNQLDSLIEQDPKIGQAFVYDSEKFVENIIASLYKIGGSHSIYKETLLLLGSSRCEDLAPEDYNSIHQIVRQTGTSYKIVSAAMSQLANDGVLGKVRTYRRNIGRPGMSLSPDQTALVTERVNQALQQRPPKRQPGRYSPREIAALLDVSASTVRKHLAGHEPLREFTGSVDVYTYGEETVEELKAKPEIISLQTAPVAPEGVITISHFAKPRKVSPDRVRALSRKYHMPIGTYRFGDRVGEGYTPHDLNYLAALLDEEASRYHVIGTNEFSMNMAANELSMSSGVTILKVATLLSENDPVFGEIVYRRVSKSIAPVLNKTQLEIVGNYIKEHGLRRGPRRKI